MSVQVKLLVDCDVCLKKRWVLVHLDAVSDDTLTLADGLKPLPKGWHRRLGSVVCRRCWPRYSRVYGVAS